MNRFEEFMPPVKNEKPVSLAEKLKEFKAQLMKKAQEIFRANRGELDQSMAKERLRQLNPLDQSDMFMDFDGQIAGGTTNLRLIGQDDGNYNPEREKDYNKWDLTSREEAERWLKREIIVNEKLAKFYQGESISADSLIDANKDVSSGDRYLLLSREAADREPVDYQEAEGRAITRTLLDLQENLKATEMIQEIMAENGITTKLEMEQKIFEDYFDHFDGYQENTGVILSEMKHQIKEEIALALEKYRPVIENRQLAGDEYSLTYGNCNLGAVIFKQGRALLADWRRAGKTQNKELSLVYDLGEIMADKLENTDSIKNTEAFIAGIEAELYRNYGDKDRGVATAVINLAKFRSLAMILDGLRGEKKKYALTVLRQAIEASQ